MNSDTHSGLLAEQKPASQVEYSYIIISRRFSVREHLTENLPNGSNIYLDIHIRTKSRHRTSLFPWETKHSKAHL